MSHTRACRIAELVVAQTKRIFLFCGIAQGKSHERKLHTRRKSKSRTEAVGSLVRKRTSRTENELAAAAGSREKVTCTKPRANFATQS